MSQQYGFRASNNLAEAENHNACLDGLGINRSDLPLLENASALGVTETDYQAIIGLTSNLEDQLVTLSGMALNSTTAVSNRATITGSTFTGNIIVDTVNNDRPFTPLNGSIIGPSTVSYFSPPAGGTFSTGGEYRLGPVTAGTITTSNVDYTGAVQAWNPRFERYKNYLRVQEQPSWTVRYSPLYLPPPTAIAGCQMWLDAEYSTMSLDDSNGIVFWRSLTGGGVAQQPSVGNRPVYTTNVMNGKPAIRFDGTAKWLNAGNLGALFPSEGTMVCIVRVLDLTYNIFSTINNYLSSWNEGGYGRLGIFTNDAIFGFPSSAPVNGTLVVSVRASATYGLEMRVNGQRIDYRSSGFTFFGGNSFFFGAAPGSGDYFNGDIYSFALYNRILTDKELGTIEECFAWRYDGVYDPDRPTQVLQLEDFATIELEDGSPLNS